MAELRAFRGIRYASSADLAKLVCPPYDIISAEDQARLLAVHPHNAVRLELPKPISGETTGDASSYFQVAETFLKWLDLGVLRPDENECLYVYRQDFRDPAGARCRVTGVLGALALEPYGGGAGILPHERTMAGPVADRLNLLRASPVNFSPIYAIYKGAGTLSPYFDALEGRPTAARFVAPDHTLQRLWVISAPAEITMLASALRTGPVVIADGHHRYETALAFHAEQQGRPGGHDAIMSLCVDADAEDVLVLPYHRAISSDISLDLLRNRLVKDWKATPVPNNRLETAIATSDSAHPFVFVLRDGAFLVEPAAERVERLLGGRAAAHDLHVVALHDALLPELFKDSSFELEYIRDASAVVDRVREGGSAAGVLLGGLHPAQIVDAARTGDRIPEKASYFWPKALTGLVFRSLR